ncbi:MAG: YidC/Oxa1 family membrane protein insertase [Candidatus Buchananbacteria bacterium]|nr:YidC/Oxa1 family membrane protein insertase [Candidatus Buchananbacteria bacterium]
MVQLFNVVLYQPILNALVFLYNIIPGHDLGIAIIILTILVKLLIYPLTRQSIKGQKALQDLQPKIDALKLKYKDNKEQQAKEMMELYKQEKVNPLSSCLPLLIQLPLLIAVYRVFIDAIPAQNLDSIYSFINNPGQLNPIAFGFVNLAIPNVVLAVLAGAAQFWQTKMLMTKKAPKNMPGAKDENMMAMMNKQMQYFMPIITIIIGLRFPGGLTLYWFVLTLLTALQQVWMFRHDDKNNPPQIIEGQKIEDQKKLGN